MVTSNTSECINSMIDVYRSDGWTDLLKGILQKMTSKISENWSSQEMLTFLDPGFHETKQEEFGG